jgi:hypothetical protein
LIKKCDFGQEKEGDLKGHPNFHIVFDPANMKDLESFIQQFLQYVSTANQLGDLINRASVAFQKVKKGSK